VAVCYFPFGSAVSSELLETAMDCEQRVNVYADLLCMLVRFEQERKQEQIHRAVEVKWRRIETSLNPLPLSRTHVVQVDAIGCASAPCSSVMYVVNSASSEGGVTATLHDDLTTWRAEHA
jgi:hypothetical protein